MALLAERNIQVNLPCVSYIDGFVTDKLMNALTYKVVSVLYLVLLRCLRRAGRFMLQTPPATKKKNNISDKSPKKFLCS